MKVFECKCGSTDVFTEQSGNNTGLYCADCGKWIKWLNKDELRLANRQIENQNAKVRADVIEDYNKKIDYLKNCYVDACNMCTRMECDVCTISNFIEDLEQLKEQNNADRN